MLTVIGQKVVQKVSEGRALELDGRDLVSLVSQNIDVFKDDHVLLDPVTWELYPENIIKIMTKDEILARLRASGKISEYRRPP